MLDVRLLREGHSADRWSCLIPCGEFCPQLASLPLGEEGRRILCLLPPLSWQGMANAALAIHNVIWVFSGASACILGH